MKQLMHSVLITGDNTDVFGGTIVDDVPEWARHLIVITGFSDYDSLIDLVVNRDEYMRQSAAGFFAADNTLVVDMNTPQAIIPVSAGKEFPVNMNWNVVTAGTGLAVALYTSS